MELLPQRNMDRPAWATKDFLDEFAALPGEDQSRVRKAFVRWRLGAFAKGLNDEKLHTRSGREYRSLRGSRTVRLLYVLRGESVLFFAVNRHDYEEPEDRDFAALAPAEDLAAWDPATPEEEERALAAPEDDAPPADPDRLPEPFPFASAADLPDRLLLGLGVLWEDLAAVRSVRDTDQLLNLMDKHPGKLPETTLLDLIEKPYRSFAQSEFRKRILAGTASAGEAKDVDGGRPEDLDYWRAASLERFRTWLSPDQRDAVTAHVPGPLAVLGAAGTGKTVVALHRAHYLARAVFDRPDDRVLLTTFSLTLAQDLAQQLDEICGDDPGVRGRIAVRNVDEALREFLQRNGVAVRLDFQAFNYRAKALMKRAAREAHYRGERRAGWLWQEFSTAVEGFGIRREGDYVGRVLPGPEPKPDDAEKRRLWPVFRRFGAIAEEEGFWTPGRAVDRALRMLAPGGGADPATRYAAVVVDETQDMSRERLRFLAAVCARDPAAPADDALTFCGDARQRIYDHGASLRSCGIAVADTRVLRRNYRSTDAIRRRAETFLEGVPMDDLDGDLVVRKPSLAARPGVPPEERRCADDAEEGAAIVEAVLRWIAEDSRMPGSPKRRPGEYAVLSPSKRRLEPLRAALEAAGLHALVVTEDAPPPQKDRSRVRVMTLHRAKGLEFQGVALDLDAQNWPMPPSTAQTLVPKERERRERRARCLVYAGMTRAIRRVLLTGVGPVPPGFPEG